eukprot:1142576-Pelagomonas_calceolata.AAC.2
MQGPKEGGKHVCFVGPQGELPAGDGTYGTSIHMGKAMDPANDILIAYKQVSLRCQQSDGQSHGSCQQHLDHLQAGESKAPAYRWAKP